MNEKFTLFTLLNIGRNKFNQLKKLTICSTSSGSLMDRLNADIEEYYIDDIPYYLLRKEVFSVNYYENTIVVLK